MRTPAGWAIEDTGGGCTAFYRTLGTLGGHALITAGGDAMAPTSPREPVTLGIYGGGDDSRQLVCFDLPSTAAAVAIVNRITGIQEEYFDV